MKGKYCFPWTAGLTKFTKHFEMYNPQKILIGDVCMTSDKRIYWDVYGEGKDYFCGDAETIDEAKCKAEDKIKELGYSIIDQKWALII